VLGHAIRHCGTTFSDFQNVEGRSGGYQRYLKVYKREGEPCALCGEAIMRLSQQGRNTFFCPRCQRNSRRR
jgi:formamidopyrimidine-DNA glycosylase